MTATAGVLESEIAIEAIAAELRRLTSVGFVGSITINLGPRGPSSIVGTVKGGPANGWTLSTAQPGALS